MVMANENPTGIYNQVFEEEFLPQLDALYTFAYHLTFNEDDANDLVQETFMKAWRSIASYETGTNAKAWLFKILKNAFINQYRKRAKQPTSVDIEQAILRPPSGDDDRFSSVSLDLSEELFQEMMGDEVTNAINELDVGFRIVILLCDVAEFTYEEISKILGIPIGTVRSRLHRGRNALKDKLRTYAESMGFKENR
ncbi:MAG TPA: sigma-70 family RNA polymerase sigma factor [Flavilitoribacter sp.]|nr:sigma-70 family RNA polymerase sigma factor [Lewinellaceae bacterium]HMQ60933.1 sigma-70 family RNA polymerase sigma factor [Flavilitoribacter sp.]HMQ86019.1 sigma-70 family RNA polymerase sigma factor [Flavilitoribacter sp.]